MGLSIWLLCMSCIEEIGLNTKNFESLLVIEARITDEVKQQEIFISRTFRFEEEEPSLVSNADVVLLADGSVYANFEETSTGIYTSTFAFAVQENVDYSLNIQTQDGKSYTSTTTKLPGTAEIESVNAEASQDSFGNDGVSILINSIGNNSSGNYFKFEYEETYKIIAPFWKERDFFIREDEESCDFDINLRLQEERVCYNTLISKDIVLANSLGLSNGLLNNFEVRFIDIQNTIIAHRYSILVKQYVITEEAFNYFESRRELSTQDNVFSQTQPGFLEGNITSVDSPNEEKVIGLFYAASVTQSRLYFNWTELYPNQPPPEIPCRIITPPLFNRGGECNLKELVEANVVRYYGINQDQLPIEGPYDVVYRPCGDCTTRGSNVVPEFWEE